MSMLKKSAIEKMDADSIQTCCFENKWRDVPFYFIYIYILQEVQSNSFLSVQMLNSTQVSGIGSGLVILAIVTLDI